MTPWPVVGVVIRVVKKVPVVPTIVIAVRAPEIASPHAYASIQAGACIIATIIRIVIIHIQIVPAVAVAHLHPQVTVFVGIGIVITVVAVAAVTAVGWLVFAVIVVVPVLLYIFIA